MLPHRETNLFYIIDSSAYFADGSLLQSMLNRFGRFLVIFLILLSFAVPFLDSRSFAQPDEAGVELVASAGFGGLEVNYGGGGWAPFRIQVANQGESIVGRLAVLSKSSQGQTTPARAYVKDVQLPTGSRQFHEIAAYINTNEDVDVQLVSQNKIIAATTVKVERQTGYGNDNVRVAVVDNDSTTLNNISALQLAPNPNRLPFEKVTLQNTPTQTADPNQATQQAQPAPNNRNRRGYMPQHPTVRPVVIAPEEMPRDFVSYDPIDVVVINDAPLNQLNEDQSRALKNWVASGGMLVVTGGADLTGLRTSGLDALLPVDAQGSSAVAALTELTDTYGAFENKDQLLAVAAKARPTAKTIIGTPEQAIVAESRYGNGLVRFIAVNPKLNPYRSWGANKYLWTDVLANLTNARNSPYPGRRSFRGNFWGVQNFLFKLAEIKPASSSVLLIFLLLYVLTLGPVNYFTLKWLKKLDLAWVTIPGVIILFTLLSVVFAQFNRTGTVSSDTMAVEVFQREGVKQVSGGVLIKPDSDATQEIKLNSRDAYANDMQQNGPPSGSTEPIETWREAGRFLLRVPSTNGAASIFTVRSMSEVKAPLFSINEAGGSNVKIKNLTDEPISNAVCVTAAGISDIFTLSPGEERQVGLNPPQAMPFWNWYNTQIAADSALIDAVDALSASFDRGAAKNNSKLQEFLDRGLMTDTYKSLERPMLFGFVDAAATEIEIGSSQKRKSKSFYLVHL